MEVLNCTVDYRGTQLRDLGADPGGEVGRRRRRSSSPGSPPSAITVHTTLLGGGLGRKFEQDFVAEAIQVGMKLRKPVMLVYPAKKTSRTTSTGRWRS